MIKDLGTINANKEDLEFKSVSQSEFMAFICTFTLSLTEDGFKVL